MDSTFKGKKALYRKPYRERGMKLIDVPCEIMSVYESKGQVRILCEREAKYRTVNISNVIVEDQNPN